MSVGVSSLRPARVDGAASAQPRWGITGVKPREVSRIYWELLPATEVLVPLQPLQPDGAPVRFHLVFHAFFPGRAGREWSTGLMAWPKGAPERLAVTAQAFPLTFAVPELSLRFNADGRTYDLTPAGGQYRHVGCPIATEDCTPNGVEADMTPDLLRALVTATRVEGSALGTRFVLQPEDRDALAAFARRIGLSPESKRRPS
jgi:hypothetical protein